MIKKYMMPDTCVIEVETTTRDADYLNVDDWVPVVTVSCRLDPAGQGDSERVSDFASQESIRVLKRLIVPHDTALDVGQRVTVNAEVYYIAALNVNSSDEAFVSAVVVQMVGADNG